MKITGYSTLHTFHVRDRPIGDANGAFGPGASPVSVLLLHTDGGLTGVAIGGHDDIDRVFAAIEGEDPRAVVALYDRMLAHVFKAGHAGNIFGTLGTIDIALWDLKAKMADEPLWRTLGARDRFVPGYASGLDVALTDEQLADLYAKYADRGFAAGKLKGGHDPETDIRRLKLIKGILGANSPRPAIMLDANESWYPKQAVRYLHQIEQELDLTWIEEPVRRWDTSGLASVSRGARAAVATGENLTGLDQYRPLIEAHAVDIVQAGHPWGITHFLRVANLAFAHDLPVSPVGAAGNPSAHGAASVPNHIVSEVQDLDTPFGVTVDQEFADGGIVLGDKPGLGIEADAALIEATPIPPTRDESNGPHVRPERAGLRYIPD